MNTAMLINEQVGGEKVFKAMFEGRCIAKSTDRFYVVKSVLAGLSAKARRFQVTQLREDGVLVTLHDKTPAANAVLTTLPNQEAVVPMPKFSINERFEFLETLTRMVIHGDAVSLLVTGPGGYGKTYTVTNEMKKADLTFTTDFEEEKNEDHDGEDIAKSNPADVHIIKGFSTAKGLYRTLWENNGKLVIFDDCDSIFKDQNAVNILKGALDSYDERWISWNAEARPGEINPPPRKFLFTGRIIFISNFSQSQVDGAIKSRCLRVDLSMTAPEKIERMTSIVQSGHFMKDSGISQDIQMQAVAFLDKFKDFATELSMRTLISTTNILVKAEENGSNDWERLALYNLTAGI